MTEADYARLRAVEDAIISFRGCSQKIDEIYALLFITKVEGKPCLVTRVKVLETWRESSTTRYKSRWAAIWSFCGALIVVVCDRVVWFISKKFG
jgi:hypothetical protein